MAEPEKRFFNLSTLLPLQRSVAELDPDASATARRVAGVQPSEVRRLGLLAGSFNPLTEAHLALASAAQRSGRIDGLMYLIATRTVNKERIEGATLADRLLCLEDIVGRRPTEGVLLVNRGLYVDQAEAIRAAFPRLEEIWFVVGFDKIEQIFDPQYYLDFASALRRLFHQASFLVAPRGDAGASELKALLRRSTNRPYVNQVHLVDLEPRFRVMSSSRVRSRIGGGATITEVPPIVQDFIEATGAYQPPIPAPDGESIDRYTWRERIIDLVRDQRLPMLTPPEFCSLWEKTTRLDLIGQRLRAKLIALDDGLAEVNP